jgi:hypothetical protein
MNFEQFIAKVDKITLIRSYEGQNLHDSCVRTKIHFQNLARPTPTLLIKHWNEEKREELKVSTVRSI